MPGKSGLDIFGMYPQRSFDVIFTTAHIGHSIQAFRLSALDYLLKPINTDELVRAVSRHVAHFKLINQEERLKVLQSNLLNQTNRLAVTSQEGFDFIDCEDIMWCEADGSYTRIHLVNGASRITSNSLKYVDEAILNNSFVRIHHSILVNLNYYQRFIRAKQCKLVLQNGLELNVSHRRRQDLIDKLGTMR